ncbi:MAG: hypothetical protein Q6356_007885 [Candidatus Wukongarchaeota archaeon]|nr:hypothetical protein [Candidatus Wukongarchaeota archaeon]
MFELIEQKPKTQVYGVHSKSNGEYLGKIYWYFGWRQYIFESRNGIIWSIGCMQQLQDFIKSLMEARKIKPHGDVENKNEA